MKSSVEKNASEENVIDEDGNVKFSRITYDLELYQSILTNIKNFDLK